MNKALLIFFLMFCCFGIAQNVIMQDGLVYGCSGTFYDSGGPTEDYGNNENLEITLCPDTPGQQLQLVFTDFNTQSGTDVMTVFDGDDSTSLVIGYYYGPNIPGTVRATPSNATGCLTIQFESDASVPSTGWVANIQCFEPCQTITAQLDSAIPAPNVDGYIRVCPNEDITLMGSGVFSDDGTGATYEWDLGDGRIMPGQNATFSYPNPGVYIANLNIRDTNTAVFASGCPNTNLINQVIQVGNEPDFTGTQPAETSVCFGDSTTIEGVVTPVEFIEDCTPPVSGANFLPDGTGVSYETTLSVECFGSSQILTDINQLLSICLNMEHSFLGDLTIEIISPNGQSVVMQDPSVITVAPSANLGTPWAAGALDSQSNNTTPGIGGQYCFVPGNAYPTLEDGVITGGVFTFGNGPSTYIDSYVPNGNYSSINPLSGLVGSPLNGIWTIRITDNFQEDNGYIFSWELNFDPSIQPPDYSFTPTINSESWDADPSITNITGNTITVQPATSGTHCYTYRVVDDFGCEYTEQVCIDVLPEVVTATPNTLFACDTGAPPYLFDLTENTPVVLASSSIPSDLVVSYHETPADANSGTNSIDSPSSYSGTDGQTIYTRIEYLNSGCYEVETFTLGLTNPPIINPVLDLETCDDNSNDGFEAFDLESQTLTILGAQLPADYNVTYHTSLANAESGSNALSSPYTNTVNPQPIYVRVERADEASCYSTSGAPLFNLIVDYRAIANQPNTLESCDDVSNDGIEQFDLTSQDGTILGAQDPSLFTISYYDNQTDANTGTNSIPNPTTYLNTTSPQTVYVRIEENANTSCYGLNTFDLVVNPMPNVVMPTPLDTCDDETPDGISEFDLRLKDNEITAGDPNLVVSYYETNADAQAQNSVITNPTMYTNRSVNALPANPQTLYVVVTNTVTACVNYTILTLNVLPNPTPNTDPTDLTQCDDTSPGDLREVFDLTVNEVYIINGQSGVTATYYISEANAEAGSNLITTPTAFTNTTTPQTIYVRMTDDVTGCYTVVNFDIIVSPLPQATTVTDLTVCEDNSTGFYAFDLDSKTNEVLNGQDPTVFAVTYHETQAEADNLMNPLPSPYPNTANPQQIFVAITNTVSGCLVSTPSFYIEVQEIPEANSDTQPIVYTLCDNIGDNDGLAQFDLTTQDTNVLDGQSPANFTVTYYSLSADANAGVNPIPTLYENTTNPQIIYARVDDDSTPNSVCYAVTNLTLRVELLPMPDLEDSYVLCVNSNGTEVVAPPVLDTGLSNTNYSFEWSLDGTVISGETNSSLIPGQGGTYSVTVTDNTTSCQNSDSAEVIESAPPIVTAEVTTEAFAENASIEATATGVGEYEFRLDFGPWQDSGIFENVSGGEHTVTARDKVGCGMTSATVMVIDYPLYFTPNGDAFNDTWNVKGFGNQYIAAIYIYDRFGKLLKQISPFGDGWNGTFNGALMPSSDYWFTVVYEELGSGERKEFKSHFSLKR
ncbi:MAG TPA: T9SS type B sorting domain-containing protein [Flavobacteriaceae bacterium]